MPDGRLLTLAGGTFGLIGPLLIGVAGAADRRADGSNARRWTVNASA